MSKSVSWKISPRDRLVRSAPAKIKSDRGFSRREQPTWSNCKSDRPMTTHSHHVTRTHFPTTSSMSTFSANSMYNISFITSSENITEPKKGREIFRKKAFTHLRLNFPSRFVKFDPSDLKAKTRVLSTKKQKTKKYSEAAKEVIKVEKSQNRFYMFNGVQSRAYRRPSVQFAEIDELSAPKQRRRFSEPVIPTYTGDKGSQRPEILSFPSGKISPETPSTSAPATIASNDVSVKTTTKQDDPEYLKRGWKSDILSRYSVAEPWTSKHRTNRYFPKHNNFQDLYCKNPYLVPNGLLFDTTDR